MVVLNNVEIAMAACGSSDLATQSRSPSINGDDGALGR
jgi:hypothetical protein